MKPAIAICLVALVMQTAIARAQHVGGESTWSRFLSGTKRFVQDPLGRQKSPQPSLPPQLRDEMPRAGSALENDGAPMRLDAQVRPATAIEPSPAAKPARRQAAPAPKPASRRERRPPRSISQYMAEEKP